MRDREGTNSDIGLGLIDNMQKPIGKLYRMAQRSGTMRNRLEGARTQDQAEWDEGQTAKKSVLTPSPLVASRTDRKNEQVRIQF